MKYIITSNSLPMTLKHKGMVPTEMKGERELLRDLQPCSCRPCGIKLQSFCPKNSWNQTEVPLRTQLEALKKTTKKKSPATEPCSVTGHMTTPLTGNTTTPLTGHMTTLQSVFNNIE